MQRDGQLEEPCTGSTIYAQIAGLAQAAAKKARDSDTLAYQRWLEEGTAKGMRPLFRAIKSQETSSQRPYRDKDIRIRGLLRLEFWAQLWRSASVPPPPLPNSLTEAARTQAEGLRPITGEFLQKYCRHLPEKAGGPDGWSTQMLRGLTREQYHQLASVFNRAYRQGVVPSQWGITSVTTLPKKPTVERPIGLMHVCAKAMLKSRWRLIEEWNHHFQQIAPWDQARVGVSAIEVGAARLLRTEIHAAHDLHGVTLFNRFPLIINDVPPPSPPSPNNKYSGGSKNIYY